MKLSILDEFVPFYFTLPTDEYHAIIYFLTNQAGMSYKDANNCAWPTARRLMDWHIVRMNKEEQERQKAQTRAEAENWVEQRLKDARL